MKIKSFIRNLGFSACSLFQTLAFLKRIEAAALNVSYVSVLTPGYFKNAMTDQALIDYYCAIADQSPYPVLLYCAPRFANNVCISPQVLQVLAEHPNIVGIKDTSDNMMSSYMSSVGGLSDFSVVAGSLRNVMGCLEKGGTAGVISAANYFPNACAKLFAIAKTDGLEAAMSYHGRLQALVSQTGGRSGVSSVKAAMEAIGYDTVRGGQVLLLRILVICGDYPAPCRLCCRRSDMAVLHD